MTDAGLQAPQPLIFPAGLVWESIPDPKSQGGRAQSGICRPWRPLFPGPARQCHQTSPTWLLSHLDPCPRCQGCGWPRLRGPGSITSTTHPQHKGPCSSRQEGGKALGPGEPQVQQHTVMAANTILPDSMGLNPGSRAGTGSGCPSFLMSAGGDHSTHLGRML